MLAVSRLALWHQVVLIEVLRHLLYNEPLDDLRHEGEVRDGSIVLWVIRVSAGLLQDWCNDGCFLRGRKTAYLKRVVAHDPDEWKKCIDHISGAQPQK